MTTEYDAIVIGSGPNGLAAAVTLSRKGYLVKVIEKHDQPGGGARTEEGPLPNFNHDVCAAIFPMAVCSPFFQDLNLEKYGVEWIQPEIALAHPLDDGTATAMHQSIEKTIAQFSDRDAKAYRRLFEPLVNRADQLIPDILRAPHIPKDLLTTMRFGMRSLLPAKTLAQTLFSDEGPRALFAGNAAHSILPLDRPISASAIGILLTVAGHKAGWPIVKGGATSITQALCDYFIELGGEIECGLTIENFDQLPPAKVYLFDTGPKALAKIASDQLPIKYRNRLNRYQYGPGVFKIDYALSEPVPWTAKECRQAGTVHLGGTLDEIATYEKSCWHESTYQPKAPFVLTAQQSLFDPSRAPEGKHTFWAYCHVPNSNPLDMTQAIEDQIERFAPGFRDVILKKQTRNCQEFERYNPNYVGGDIIGGATTLNQLVTRPLIGTPHATANPNIFLCSASTPPGAGVHGMSGHLAALRAIIRLQNAT